MKADKKMTWLTGKAIQQQLGKNFTLFTASIKHLLHGSGCGGGGGEIGLH